jgi:alpha-glucosidase
MLALPGSSYLYQGEELGLPEVIHLPDSAREDPT